MSIYRDHTHPVNMLDLIQKCFDDGQVIQKCFDDSQVIQKRFGDGQVIQKQVPPQSLAGSYMLDLTSRI